MSKEFMGRGWRFPVKVDGESAKIQASEYEQDIKDAIWIILSTSKGERVMRPDFGCGIHDFAFEVINIATLSLAEMSVKEALIRWEPRIEVKNIKASYDDSDTGKLIISIDYKVRTNNNRHNLVYPFYLREG